MEAKRLFQNAGIITIGALISRVLGYARETILAAKFGTSAPRGAFDVGSYIPITLSNLLVAGMVSAVFIPIFTKYLYHNNKEEIKHIYAVVVNQFTLMMIGLMVVLYVLSPWIIKIQAPGFKPDQYQMTLQIFQIALPSVYFLGLAALNAGTLNSLKIFGIPTLGGIIFNTIVVLVTFFYADQWGINSVAYALIIGSIGQFLIQYIWVEKYGLGYRFTKQLSHPAMKEIYGLVLPVLIGSGVNYLAPLIEKFFGSYLEVDAIPALGYAFKTSQFPIGIFALAISAVVFPTLSENIICKDHKALVKNLSWALRFVLFIIVPAALGLMAIGKPVIRLLFERDEFTTYSTILTSKALFWYSLALVPWSITAVLVKIFYSSHDTKTPVYVALITVLFLFVTDAALVKIWNYQGLAIGTMIAAYVNVVILWIIVRNKYKCLRIQSVLKTAVSTIIASSIMAVSLFFISEKVTPRFLNLSSDLHRAIEVFLLLAIGIGIYSAFIFVFDRKEIKEVVIR